MSISSFDDLLQAARQQPEPQRLLFVFASADLPDDSTPEQRERFLAGQGGALVPMMYADKLPQDLHTFADLVRESEQFEKAWTIVFASSLSGIGGVVPTSEAAEQPLQRMVESIKTGTFGTFIPFDREGHPVILG
jgi:hypothetical protein